MTMSMSPTFLVVLLVALAVVVFWRIALQVLVAVLLALLVFGISQAAEAVTGEPAEPPPVVAPGPAAPIPGPDLAVPDELPGEGTGPR
jgi:hypothetical protein